jgi:hypothetical protein
VAEVIHRVSLRGKVEIEDMPDELDGEPEDIIGSRVHGTFEAILTGRNVSQEGPETRRGIGETTPLLLDKLTIRRVDAPPEPEEQLPGMEDEKERRADLR